MRYLITVLLAFLFVGCNKSTDYSRPEDIMANAHDALKKYSYYQSRIPGDIFQYQTPAELYYHISDFLKGGRYTFFVEGYDVDGYLGNFTVSDKSYYFGLIVGSFNDTLFCSQVLKGSSADTCGLKIGDRIIAIDSFSLHGNKTVFDAVTKVGNKDYSFKIEREGVLDTLTVAKKDLGSPVSYSVSLTDSVGYIYLSTFLADSSTAGGSSSTQFIRSLQETVNHPVTIIDLRNNGGGYVSEALTIVSQFVDAGDTMVITEAPGSAFDTKKYAMTTGTAPTVGSRKFVLLVNHGSASASEMVVSALRYNNQIPVVGDTTYGKAIGQGSVFFFSGAGATKDTIAAAHITMAKYFYPNEDVYEEVGFIPDHVVGTEPTTFMDPQLEKALSVAEEMIGIVGRSSETVVGGGLSNFNKQLPKAQSVVECGSFEEEVL